MQSYQHQLPLQQSWNMHINRLYSESQVNIFNAYQYGSSWPILFLVIIINVCVSVLLDLIGGCINVQKCRTSHVGPSLNHSEGIKFNYTCNNLMVSLGPETIYMLIGLTVIMTCDEKKTSAAWSYMTPGHGCNQLLLSEPQTHHLLPLGLFRLWKWPCGTCRNSDLESDDRYIKKISMQLLSKPQI